MHNRIPQHVQEEVHFEEFNEVDWANPATFDFSVNPQEMVEFLEDPLRLTTPAEMILARVACGFPMGDELTFFRN